MRPTIKDEFTDLPISRQRRYQLRMQKAGRCVICGEPAISGNRCLKHAVLARERMRKRKGSLRRYTNTASYLAERATAKQENA